MCTKLRIWSDRSYLLAGYDHAEIFIPFWGKNPEDPCMPTAGLFDQYMQLGSNFFEMTSLERADLAIMPGKWEQIMNNSEYKALAFEFLKRVHQSGKPTVIFLWSDYSDDLEITNAIIFRTSLYRSIKKSFEFAMPAWSEDFVMKYLQGNLPVRPKRKRPRVGFCGFSENITPQTVAKHYLKKGLYKLGIMKSETRPPIRGKALKIMAKDKYLDTDFIIRKSFQGGALNKNGTTNPIIMNKVRLEYLNNIINNDYILCVRGVGNYSYRLYETLCCGKIPVFIDSDCELPFNFNNDWKKLCVWVHLKELPVISEKIAEFHEALSPQAFLDLQYQCRRFWKEWLSPEGFFSNLHSYF